MASQAYDEGSIPFTRSSVSAAFRASRTYHQAFLAQFGTLDGHERPRVDRDLKPGIQIRANNKAAGGFDLEIRKVTHYTYGGIDKLAAFNPSAEEGSPQTRHKSNYF